MKRGRKGGRSREVSPRSVLPPFQFEGITHDSRNRLPLSVPVLSIQTTSSRTRAGRAEFPDRKIRRVYLRNQESLQKGDPHINPGN